MTPEEAKQRLASDKIEFIWNQFVDIHGQPKVKVMPTAAFDLAHFEGPGFAGGSVYGMGQGPEHPDMCGRIDLSSYTKVPWETDCVRFASNLFVDGNPHPFCSRTNLQRVLAQAADLGYTFNVGVEPEHFLVTRDNEGNIQPWDPRSVDRLAKPCYDYAALAPAMQYVRAMLQGMNKLGWEAYQMDHEDAPGQYEINFKYADALTTCDRLTFLRMMAREYAWRLCQAYVTFKAKPFPQHTGSGLHMHFHLAEKGSGKNLFKDTNDNRGLGLSELAYKFLGGIFHNAYSLCAVLNPTANCYKRIQVEKELNSSSGYTWTPARIAYGGNNRTLMIRVPEPGHCEDRSPSSACNPYLAMAAYLAAGLDGIANNRDPGESFMDSAYIHRKGKEGEQVRLLPQSLKAALIALEGNKVVQGALGPIAEPYLEIKGKESKHEDPKHPLPEETYLLDL